MSELTLKQMQRLERAVKLGQVPMARILTAESRLDARAREVGRKAMEDGEFQQWVFGRAMNSLPFWVRLRMAARLATGTLAIGKGNVVKDSKTGPIVLRKKGAEE